MSSSFPKAYTSRFPSAKLGIEVDLTAADWVSNVGTILETAPQPTSSLYVGTAGDLRVVMAGNGQPVTFKGHPVGYTDIGVTRILKAGTTAADIVALY